MTPKKCRFRKKCDEYDMKTCSDKIECGPKNKRIAQGMKND